MCQKQVRKVTSFPKSIMHRHPAAELHSGALAAFHLSKWECNRGFYWKVNFIKAFLTFVQITNFRGSFCSLGTERIQYIQCTCIYCYGKVGESVITIAKRKQNWLYQFYLKGNPQRTIQTNFPFLYPTRNDMSIVSDSTMDKKVKGERTITLDREKNFHCT